MALTIGILILVIGVILWAAERGFFGGYCEACNNTPCTCLRCPHCKRKIGRFGVECPRCKWKSPYRQGPAGVGHGPAYPGQGSTVDVNDESPAGSHGPGM